MSYTVYEHVAPNGKRYIGITRQRPEDRWRGGSGYSSQTLFYRAIKKYGWGSFTHNIVASGLSQEDAERMEIALIDKHRSNESSYGYNADMGGGANRELSMEHREKIGRSHVGLRASDETRRKISIANTGRCRTTTHETRQKISAALKGNKIREGYVTPSETKAKISASLAGHSVSSETRSKIAEKNRARARRVVSEKNGIVKEYESAERAAEAINAHKEGIWAACNGRRNTYYGRRWRYV